MSRENKSKAVYMCVRTHIHIHLYFPVYMCVCMFRHTCMFVCVYSYMFVCVCGCVRALCHTLAYIHVYVRLCTCMCVQACLCVFMCTGTNALAHFHQVTSDKNMDLPCLAGTGSCVWLKIVQFTPGNAFFQLINPWSGGLLHSKECKRASHNFTHGLCIKWCLVVFVIVLMVYR